MPSLAWFSTGRRILSRSSGPFISPAKGLGCLQEDMLNVIRVTNRKGHYTRALEEAIHAHTSQWPLTWEGRNPLHGGGSFNKMTPEQRV